MTTTPRQRVRLAAIAALALVPVAITTAPAGATTRVRRPPVPRLDWAPCGPDRPDLECASATVPLDYGKPRGETTTVALARLPATDRDHRIGSVFLNPGGPGGSGVQYVSIIGAGLRERLHGRFDVIGFDPRGIGASAGIRCFRDTAEFDALMSSVPAFPYRPEQYRPLYRAYRSMAERCLTDANPVVRFMSTANVARDLDLLRAAVGDRQLTYYGTSYGSEIGTTYANLFPDRVRAVAIDGVIDPRLWATGKQFLTNATAMQQEFDEFLRLCDEAGPAACGLSGPGGADARWRALLAAVRTAPLDLGNGVTITYDQLVADVTVMMYEPELYWAGPNGTGSLLGTFADLALGDANARPTARTAAAVLTRQVAASGITTAAAAADVPYDNSFEASIAVMCADSTHPTSFEDIAAVSRSLERVSPFGPHWWWRSAPGCAEWPVARDRYAGPWTATTSAPVLVVGNTFDGVTSYTGAQAVASLLPNSRLLTYAGWGHGAYDRSDCVTASVDAYLLDGTLPAVGTICPANPNPFLTASPPVVA